MRDKRIYRERDPWREKIGKPARRQSATKPPIPWGEAQQPATETPKPSGEVRPVGQASSVDQPPQQQLRPAHRRPVLVFFIAVLFGLVCAGAAYAALKYLRPHYQPLSALAVRVIDGDTISIQGVPQNIVGFNAPGQSGELARDIWCEC